MKKIFLILICLLTFSGSCFAVTKQEVKTSIKQFFETDNQKFVRIEQNIYGKTLERLEKKSSDFWNLKSLKNIDDKELQSMNAKNIEDILIYDDKQMMALYDKYKTNRNNMEDNKRLYEALQTFVKQYNELKITLVDKIYQDEYEKYITDLKATVNKTSFDDSRYHKFFFVANDSDPYIKNWQQLKEWTIDSERIYYRQIEDILTKYIDKYTKMANEIEYYSVLYEQKKLDNFYKSKYGGAKNCGNLQTVLLSPHYSPQNGCYYDSVGQYSALRVLQAINGGVIVASANENVYGNYLHFKRAFIVTNKKYVENEYIYGKYIYRGTFKYTSILGATITLWKFQEIGTPSEEFYFINK